MSQSSIGAGLLIVRGSDGKVLLVRRAQGARVGSWNPPGGGVEEGETPFEAAIREATEEVGPLPHLNFLRDEGYWHSNGPYFAFGTFLGILPAEQAGWKPRINEESSEWGWFAPDALPKPLVPGVGAAVRDLADRTWRWKPASHRMGIAAPATFSLLKVVNMDREDPFHLSTSIAVHDERTNRAVLLTVPFEDGAPAAILMPMCRDEVDREALLEHYQDLIQHDSALVLVAVDDVPREAVAEMAFREASESPDAKEAIRAVKEQLAALLEECVS